MINSGNLAIISNDEIKHVLLNIELLYKKMKSEEEHYRFDTENIIYLPLYSLIDLGPMVKNYEFIVSHGQSGQATPLSADYFEEFFKSTELKNGFEMTVLELNTLNDQMREMIAMSRDLIDTIETEVKQG